jgi:hypothetical protein
MTFGDSPYTFHSIALSTCDQALHYLHFHTFRTYDGVPAFNGEIIRHVPKDPDHPYATAPTVALLWAGLVPSQTFSSSAMTEFGG